MNACGRILLSAATWAASLSSGAGQVELQMGPPRKDLLIPPPGQGQGLQEPLRQQIQAPVMIGNRVILNGGNSVIGGEEVAEPGKAEIDPAGPQVLDFTGGQRLHGSLESLDLTRGEFLWRRSDVSAPLAIPVTEVSRWSGESKPAPNGRPAATVKFTGGDWLAAYATMIQGDKVQLQLADGTALTTNRAHIEWIYFSRTSAAEAYDGPTSLAGWNSAGAWSHREGALRATAPSPISRMFRSLPDQVEYRMLVDQGDIVNAFTVSLHSRNAALRGLSRGAIQLMLRAGSLNLWASIDGTFKTEQVDLTKSLGGAAERAKGPMLFRVFEDFTGGRLLVYLNDRKAAEWSIDKGEPGKNGGSFQFQPSSWAADKEQSIYSIRIIPWDGREPTADDERAADRVVVGGTLKTGKVTAWDGRTLKLMTENGGITLPAEQIGLVRFQRPPEPPDDDAPIAQVKLRGRGEFDAIKLDWRSGKFQVLTNFGGQITLAPEAVEEITFHRSESKPEPTEDLLVFQNGDRLYGTLQAVQKDGKLRWRTSETAPAVEFAPTHVAGLQFSPRVPRLPASAVVRFRNDDWLAGGFITLDPEQVVFSTAEAGQITTPRAMVKALYFGTDGAPAVSDGASDHIVWERGFELNTGNSALRQKLLDAGSPWSYFAGSYSLARPGGIDPAYNRIGGLQLGQFFKNLATRAEVSFTVTSEQPVYFNAQLFTEPNNPGYMVHLSSIGVSLYDMNPRGRVRGITQQQFKFPPEITPNARTRQVRFLAERTSGRLTILVDSVIVGQVKPKVTDSPRNLGRGILITPQSNQLCTYSNLWVGPWNGLVPGKTAGPNFAADTVVLANGDEVQGTVEMATPTTLKVASDVGTLDLPVERLTMVDFGGAPIERRAGTRLHLAGQGALTVTAWRIENETLICQSEIAGQLKLPLAAVQEVVFAAPTPKTAKGSAEN